MDISGNQVPGNYQGEGYVLHPPSWRWAVIGPPRFQVVNVVFRTRHV